MEKSQLLSTLEHSATVSLNLLLYVPYHSLSPLKICKSFLQQGIKTGFKFLFLLFARWELENLWAYLAFLLLIFKLRC